MKEEKLPWWIWIPLIGWVIAVIRWEMAGRRFRKISSVLEEFDYKNLNADQNREFWDSYELTEIRFEHTCIGFVVTFVGSLVLVFYIS